MKSVGCSTQWAWIFIFSYKPLRTKWRKTPLKTAKCGPKVAKVVKPHKICTRQKRVSKQCLVKITIDKHYGLCYNLLRKGMRILCAAKIDHPENRGNKMKGNDSNEHVQEERRLHSG